MTNAHHLLVPIKVQALVIDDLVIKRRATLKKGEQRNVANDGKWSPLAQDYRPLINAVGSPAPRPFYGARHKDGNETSHQLVLPADPPDSPVLPQMSDRGVYLHWVLPSGLRHSYTPGSLDFLALPDQWLIVRFCRRGAKPEAKAWFVDGGLVVDSDGPANLLLANGDKYEARRVGKVVPLDGFDPKQFEGERTIITAVGNPQTGSPTFTAFVAENRNILSWHDNLNDLREPPNEGPVPTDVTLSYVLLGWYRDKQNEPLATLHARFPDMKVMDALGWQIDSPLPADLLNRRCLFHGMVAHVNYWSPDTHKGPMLGYPGSPSVGGVLGDTPPSFKVGVGNNAEDALVSLVSSESSGDDTAPNLWKALEAVIYRQPESLVGSWNAAPRDHAVHQSWFSAREAGKVWAIRPLPGREDTLPAAQAAAGPTPKQFTSLKKINDKQSEADAAGRELTALQQDLYGRWWKLCELSRRDSSADLGDDEDACRALAERVKTLRRDYAGLFEELQTLVETLTKELEGKKPQEVELRFDSAPRFWTPADPVIVVKNCGLAAKHQFPRPLACRLSEQTVTAAEVKVGNVTEKFRVAATDISAAVKTRFAPHSEVLTSLLEEASLVEQAISDLVSRTLATESRPLSAKSWREWTERLVNDLTWDRQTKMPRDQISFGKLGELNVRPHQLAALWVKQPWSPLFIDWQITWLPTAQSGKDFEPAWRLGEADYKPMDKKFLPTEGPSVRGRSLLSPIDGRIFEKPIETLRDLLKGKGSDNKGDGNPAFPDAVVEILRDYQIVWDQTLADLAKTGMMGQALTGFHQTLLGRDVTRPRVMPDPKRPWVAEDEIEFRDDVVKPLLDAPNDEAPDADRLAPPSPTKPALPFSMIRAGAFKIDELWLVDDFGQWADLLRGTSAGGSAGQVFHPRARWKEDSFIVAMPPRVVQPVRLNFRFTSADNSVDEGNSDPALSPICGWIFYNPLDQALVFCNRNGRLAGELVITENKGGFTINWEAGASGVALGAICNSDLKAFAQALVETAPTPSPRLLALLKLIDGSLERIRPAAARREAALFGRPLALLSASLGLELFGKAWTDPQKPAAADRPSNTGDESLDALLLRVNLGCKHNVEDGLIGFFKANDDNRIVYDRIVPAHLPREVKPAGYIADPENDAERVSFGTPKPLTLLMDPWGSVQAAAGIVPAKTITLAHADLDKTLARMEASFRVGPVLLQADRFALPTPAGERGRWSFIGPLTNNVAATVVPSDPRYFSDQPVVAAEGRLLLLSPEE